MENLIIGLVYLLGAISSLCTVLLLVWMVGKVWHSTERK